MITRDMVQGFIDGLKASGDDMTNLDAKVKSWLKDHHMYPQDEATASKIASDVGSYKK